MCFFLRTSFLVRIAGGGAAPSPLHPPTRFYFVTGAPCYLLLFLLLFPSASMILVPMRFFLGTHASPLHPPTRLYFATGAPCSLLLFLLLFSISINDLGSYVLLSSYFFLGTAALPPAPPHPLLCLIRLPFLPSLIPSCHKHRLFDFILFFLILINIHGN